MKCTKEVSCEELNCDVNAECIADSHGNALCQCSHGFSGDGSSCQIIPSRVSLHGSTLQQEILVEPQQYPDIVASVEDIGPIVEHVYEVTNKGPQTLGNVEMKVLWPIKDSNGRDLTYLHEEPEVFVDTTSSGNAYSKRCTLTATEGVINPRRLPRRGAKVRRSSNHENAGEEYGDEDEDDEEDFYDENVGVVVDSSDYYEKKLSQEEKALIESYDEVIKDYDYNQLSPIVDNHNSSLDGENSLLERVAFESNDGFATFSCSVNLAPKVFFL